MTPEGKVKAMVNRALGKLPKCYRFMPVQNGMGAPGLDYYCCIDGLFVAIETKVPGKNLTPRQEVTRDQIEAAGGVVFVIHDQADMSVALAQIALRMEFWNPTPGGPSEKATDGSVRRQPHAGPNGAATGGAGV